MRLFFARLRGVGKCVPTCYARCYSLPHADIAVEAAKKSADALAAYGGCSREGSIRVLETGVDGPARILDCGYREA